MADLLRVDRDLLSAAAETSAPEVDDTRALRAWVAALPARMKDQWLRRAVDDPDLVLGTELLRAFRARTQAPRGAAPRTVAELCAAVDAQRERQEHAEALRVEKARKAAEAAKTKRLRALAKRLDAAWADLEGMIASGSYDEATKLALDLRDLAAQSDASEAFTERFEATRKRQSRRRAFFDRWRRQNAP
jgi:hypothetical protein